MKRASLSSTDARVGAMRRLCATWGSCALLAVLACTHDASTTGDAGGGDDESDASSTPPDGSSDGIDGGSAGSADAGGSDGSGSRTSGDAAVVCTAGGVPDAPGPGETTFEALPTLPTQSPGVAGNACGTSLGAAWGTNFAYPGDPYAPPTDGGPSVKNQSVLGWEGNDYAPFAYLSGSFFARGVAGTYAQTGTTYCGAMFSFGVYGAYPHPPGTVQWTMDEGYLPALTTVFASGSVAVSITNFADSVPVGGHAFELVYSRVAVTNNGTSTATVDPRPQGSLASLGAVSNDVPAGATVNHDYVVAVDDFGAGLALPANAALSQAPAYDAAYTHMKTYWDGRLSVIPVLALPDVALPSTGGLSHPGAALSDAFKAAFVYTRVMQSGAAPFSGANNYDNLLNHDAPEILANRFTLGDFQEGPNLLLAARASEATNYPEYGANWYWDGVWKTPWPWAIYLAKTGDASFVGKYFHDDSGGASAWGPSLYTMMHEIPGQLTAAGYLGTSNDNDSMGRWLFDDYSAFIGLASYKYIATVLGNATEAAWADGQLTSLMSATNAALTANQRANGFSYLPCEVDVPTGADRCATPSDANWASPVFYGQNAWDTFLMGGNPTGIVGDPAQVDGLYAWGFGRLGGALPYPTMGGYNATSYSTADNTGYAEGALFGSQYRDLPITSYAWQIATTTGGPNAWWEATKAPPDRTDAWSGNHAPVEFGACPYAWPMAGQTLALLRSIVAEGLAATSSGGSFAFTRPAYVGRGIPDAWIAAGQTIAVSNLTSSYSASPNGACERSTYGVSIATGTSGSQREVTFSLSGAWPGKTVLLQLPSFRTAGVSSVQGGTYDAAANTVTVTPGASTVVVTLGS